MIWRAGTLLLVGIVGGVLGVWMGEREMPVETLKRSVQTPIVEPGGVLRVSYTVRRRKSCTTGVERTLYDAAKTRYQLRGDYFAAGPSRVGLEEYVVPLPIPQSIVEGEAQMIATVRYACNPVHALWPIVNHGEPVRFMVARGRTDYVQPQGE